MKKGVSEFTDLVCLECGNVFIIMRKGCCLKKVSHLKNLWCYKCKKVTNHYEVRDIDKFMLLEVDDEEKLFVKDLVRDGKVEDQRKSNKVLKKILEK